MLALSESDLIGLITPQQLLDVVETALRSQAAGHVVAPKRLHMQSGDVTFLAMPAAGAGALGAKLVSVAPDNAARGYPVTNGMMFLSDGETGLPLAIMNAAMLTAQRTGAVGALGVKYLSPPHVSSIGIVGCGVQGAWQAISACAVRPIRDVFAVSRSQPALDRFVATVTRHAASVRITPCADVRELLERTHLIVTATTSSIPVLPDEADLLANRHFISVGSFRPTMQELPDSVYRLAGQLAIDSEHARQEVGDVINPVNKGLLKADDVFSIAECVMGKRVVDSSRTTVYKCVGAAVYDLFVAQAWYRAAKARGCGQEIQL